MTLRLVSYNIQRGVCLDGLRRLFAEAPAFRAANIIAIQEASFLPDGTNTLEPLARALSPEHIWTYRPVMAYPDKEYGNGFLFRSGLATGESYDVPLPQLSQLGWFEKQKTEGGVPDTKSAFVQTFVVAGHLVRVANVHLDFAGGPLHRRAQLAHLLEVMAERTGEGTEEVDILCGDFNTVGHRWWPSTGRNVATALGGATAAGFANLTGGLRHTSDLFGNIDPADPSAAVLGFGQNLGVHFRQKTDHILVRGASGVPAVGLAANASESELFRLSDHLPLQVTLAR